MFKGKAFSLLSGGLDSILATRLVMDQGIEVVGLHFITPFFGYSKKGREAEYQGKWRRLYGIEARIIDVSDGYFQVLRHPRYGYGKNFNPCIDCKIFLFSQAREIMEKEKAHFLVSGEVLGQRPMSQRRDTLRIVERDSGTEGILLRPLCAQNLKPTQPELSGIIDRERLMAITGRSRKPQMELAQKLGIQDYPSPAGGCLLTDPILAERIRKYFERQSEIQGSEVLLFLVGRHFRLEGGAHLVLGRRDAENQRLRDLFAPGDTLVRLKEIPGPLGLIRGPGGEKSLRLAGAILARYSKAKAASQIELQYGSEPDRFEGTLWIVPGTAEEIERYRF